MAQKTSIEWTDFNWNPVRGCSRVSEGCRNCYAEVMAARFSKPGQLGEGLAEIVRKPDGSIDHRWTGKLEAAPERVLLAPLKWRKPRRVFVNSTSDLFHENVPDAVIDQVFAVMALTPQHTYQILTKRPERMFKYLEGGSARQRIAWDETACIMNRFAPKWREWSYGRVRKRAIATGLDWPLPNVWLGVSVEDQATADTRIPYLLATPAAIRFLSAEPLLGEIDLEAAWHGESALDLECWGDCSWCNHDRPALHNCRRGCQSDTDVVKGRSGLDWVIVGGESGPGARPMHPEWVRYLRDQCKDAEVPFFFKQWGDYGPAAVHEPKTKGDFAVAIVTSDGDLIGPLSISEYPWAIDEAEWRRAGAKWSVLERHGKKKSGCLLDGVLHDAFPAPLQVVA
ncbi:MAG: phage Gp37/Gp68 family protein [Pseudomonadota bacterium]